MCVIIFAGERCNDLVELGIDPFVKEIEGVVSDHDYIIKNTGKGKLFPCGPECSYLGKTIPCMCRWSKNGSITGEILRDIVATLDHYNIFDRSNGKKPMFLFDGHGSRLSEPLVKYVQDIQHSWMILFGVPYGTNLWQVGDGEEQNGNYKMGMSKYKEKVMKQNLTEKWKRPAFEDTDIIPTINLAWNDSFAHCKTNRDAISTRGWNPWNYSLLLIEQIRMTMNDEDKAWEKENMEISPFSKSIIFDEQNLNLPENEDPFLHPKYPSEDTKLNFSHSEAARCIDSLVSAQDLQSARNCIEKNKQIGKKRQDLVSGIKKLSTGNLFLVDICDVGTEVAERIKNNTEKAIQMEKDAYKKSTANLPWYFCEIQRCPLQTAEFNKMDE